MRGQVATAPEQGIPLAPARSPGSLLWLPAWAAPFTKGHARVARPLYAPRDAARSARRAIAAIMPRKIMRWIG